MATIPWSTTPRHRRHPRGYLRGLGATCWARHRKSALAFTETHVLDAVLVDSPACEDAGGFLREFRRLTDARAASVSVFRSAGAHDLPHDPATASLALLKPVKLDALSRRSAPLRARPFH